MSINKCVRRAWQKASALTLALYLAAVAIPNSVWATTGGSLPTTADPSRGAAKAGDYIGLMREYAYDIFVFIGLALGTLAFIVVVKNVISAYSEVQDGKGSWGQVGQHFAVGVLLLVFVVFMLTQAKTIL